MVPVVASVESGNWEMRMQQLVFIDFPLFVFCEGRFENNHAFLFYLTYKDIDHFRNGSVHKLYCLKVCQISKVHARFHKITNEPCSNYETTVKTMTTESKINYDAETDVVNAGMVVNGISKMRRTCNWIKKILNQPT